MHATPTTRRSVAELLCGVLLVVAFAVGAFRAVDPDFDATFGLEAYRAFPWPVFVTASALLLVVLAVPSLGVGIERRVAATCDRLPGAVLATALVGGACVAFFLFTDRSLSGDASATIMNACRGHVAPSNALTGMIQVALVAALDVDPWLVFRALSVLAGAAFVALALWTAATSFEERAHRVAAVALLVTSGTATLFFGNIEMYAPLAAGLLLYLATALRRIAGADARPWPALALGLAACLHGSALVLLPSLAFLWWHAPGASRTVRSAVRWGLAFVAPVAVTAALLFFVLWEGTPPTNHAERFGNALGALGQSAFLPLRLTPSNVGYRHAILDPEHIVGALNVALFTCPVGLLLAVSGRGRDLRVRFLVLATASLVGLLLFWNVSYGLRKDWDLFATIGVALALLGASRVLRGAPVPGRAARIVALCLFAFVPVVVSNTGDARQRREYADAMVWAYERALLDDSPIADDLRPRVERHLARWREEVRRSDPRDLHGTMANAWDAVRAGENAKALRLVDEILREEPDHVQAWLARGVVYFDQERVEEARDALEHTLRLAPEEMRPQARRFLAQIALDTRDFDTAVHHLERGLREELSWPSEALGLLEMLIAVRRHQGMDDVVVALEATQHRRRTSGFK